MSCLDVMYQVYGPPQPYFAAAYTPYHQVRFSLGSGLRLRKLMAPHLRSSEHRWYPKVLSVSGCQGLQASRGRR